MNEGPAAVRSVVAVGAGFFATQMLVLGGDKVFRAIAPQAFDAHGYALDGRNLLIMLAYMAVFQSVGGYITARLAIRKPTTHALALGLVVLLMSLLLTVFTWGTAPEWYPISALLLIVPMSWLGGKLRELQAGARADRRT